MGTVCGSANIGPADITRRQLPVGTRFDGNLQPGAGFTPWWWYEEPTQAGKVLMRMDMNLSAAVEKRFMEIQQEFLKTKKWAETNEMPLAMFKFFKDGGTDKTIEHHLQIWIDQGTCLLFTFGQDQKCFQESAKSGLKRVIKRTI